jgi:hypothetical protein
MAYPSTIPIGRRARRHPLFDQIKFAPIAPCANRSAIAERQCGYRIIEF